MIKVRDKTPVVNKKYVIQSCVSHDGQNIFCGAYTGRLYVSRNRGNTFTEVQPTGATDLAWIGGAIDDDMSTILIGYQGGSLFLSKDYGSTWAAQYFTGATANWWGTASNSDGSILLAARPGKTDALWRSLNGGTSWSACSPYPNSNTPVTFRDTLATDSNGGMMIACPFEVASGTCMISFDSGATWNDRTPNGVKRQWLSAACSSDGSFIILGAYLNSVWTSTDYGVTWNERKPSGGSNIQWYASCDSTGRYCVAGDYTPGRLWYSNDYGVTWFETRPYGNVTRSWGYCGHNRNAGKYFAMGIDSTSNGRVVTMSYHTLAQNIVMKTY